jgi:methyltransferase (TIGR00027 family)
MTAAPIQDASETALMVAMWRARENEHPRPLYRDPFALQLAGERGKEIVAQFPKIRLMMSCWMMAIRTRIIDELIEHAAAGGVDTVLNLGAGLDTRPYRLKLPRDLLWIEADYPNIINLKEGRLQSERPVCKLTRMSCDLAEPVARRALLSAVASQARQALVLTEGVIPYFTETDAAALADELRSQAAYRYWIADYFSPYVLRYRQRETKKRRMEKVPLQFHPKDYFGFFSQHGWRSKEIHWIEDEAKRVGRPAPALVRVLYLFRGLFVRKQIREEMRNFMAYVLFERSSPFDAQGTGEGSPPAL